MALVVTLDGNDRTSQTVDGSVYVEQRADDFISVGGLRLVDVGAVLPIAVEQTITLIDGGTTYFSGRVVDVKYTLFGECASRYIDVKYQDDNFKLLETVVTIVEDYPNGAGHAAILSDKQIITDLFNKYSGVVAGGDVATLDANLAISVGPCTLRDAMSQICARTGGYFYVDFVNQLHYFSAEGLGVGWSLSDTPGVPAGSVGYQIEGLQKQSLAITRLDRVFIVGAGVTGWHPGAGAGRHGIARDNRITTAAGITERGTAILAKHGAIKDTFTVSTTQAGLRAGMDVAFKCIVYGEAGATYTVRKMIIKWDGCGVAYYTVTLGAPVNPALKHARNYADGIASVIPILPALPTSSRGWSHNIVFTAVSNTQVDWAGAGVITLADGSTYTIAAGNTGAMGAITYIYLDISIGSPPATLQVTANAAVAVGSGKLLVAVAQNVADATKLATFQVFGGAGQGVLVSQGHIAALSVTTNEIAANTILAGNIAAGTITANEIAAATITATEIAANTITADKIEMGIGDALFSDVDGLLLLGPHYEITPTRWSSPRGQRAIISGAFHREAGRWPGTRGLVVELATTNRLLNPSFEVNTGAWGETGCTNSSDGTYAVFGDASLKVITDDAAAVEGPVANVAGQTAADTEYTLSAYLRGSGTVRLFLWDTNGGYQYGDVITLTNVWTRYQITKTFSDGVARQVGVYTNVQQAITWYADGFQLEAFDFASSYCDGDRGVGYVWTGAAHGSISTRAATECDLDAHADLISDNNTISFRIIAQMPYAHDATWPDALNYLIDVRAGADNNNRILLAYRSLENRFGLFVNGAYRCYAEGQTFEAGDWLEIIVTLDFTGNDYNIYVDGLLTANDTTALAAPTGLTLFKLGSNITVTTHGSFCIAEFAIFDRVLTAIETAGLYAMTRPILDIGGMEKPGIYILDGAFQLASSTSGNRIVITADEIVGYDSGGTRQFYLRASDGAAVAGAGGVRLSAAGMVMVGAGASGDTRRLRFLYFDDPDERIMGNIYGNYGGGANPAETIITAWRQAGDPWNTCNVFLRASDEVAGTESHIHLRGTGIVSVGSTRFDVDALLAPGRGNADPAADLIDGCLFYRTDTDKLRLRANGAWINVSVGLNYVPINSVAGWNPAVNAVNQTINLQAAPWNLPAGIVAVSARLSYTAANNGDVGVLRRDVGERDWLVARCPDANEAGENAGIVNCDASGDIYFRTNNAVNVVKLFITGYWI